MWGLGAVLAVVGVALLLFKTGLASWIPASILGAGILIILGLIVMGMANKAGFGGGGATTVHKEETGDDSPDVVKVE